MQAGTAHTSCKIEAGRARNYNIELRKTEVLIFQDAKKKRLKLIKIKMV